ncbi:hypothetical protein K4A83_11880 [Spirulina subsalsa FACHB-351]|uniref:Uncharacterized protein n=1 Tax=Spirulina subsalsa FACHB-351 TaxID=234711 RepID=A0ABT3L633_9CYAN|nr:hypothetical protein [Spirulina subsalsa]MCW6036958.1 hypothetical protein [Spirulina subsalsa FACHB-351]
MKPIIFGQLMMTQGLGEKQHLLQDFQHIISDLLAQGDRQQKQTIQQVDKMRHEITTLQNRLEQMHAELQHLVSQLGERS